MNSPFTYEDGKIQWTGLDENSGLSHFLIYVDGEDILGKNKVYAGNAVKEGNFNYNYNGSLSKNIKVVAVDCAGNISEEVLLIGDDINSPEVYIIKPEIFDIFNKNQVLIEGYAIDESEIERISINGENVDFKYDNSNGRYEFNHILRDLEDGVQKIIISAMDKWENSIEYKFIIYIDTSKPDLEMDILFLQTVYQNLFISMMKTILEYMMKRTVLPSH